MSSKERKSSGILKLLVRIIFLIYDGMDVHFCLKQRGLGRKLGISSRDSTRHDKKKNAQSTYAIIAKYCKHFSISVAKMMSLIDRNFSRF